MSKVSFESQREIWLYLASGGRIKDKNSEIEYEFYKNDILFSFGNNDHGPVSNNFINFESYEKIPLGERENKTLEPEIKEPIKLKLYKFAYLSRSMKVWSETRNFYHSIAHVLERLKELEGDEADAIIKLENSSIEVTI